jgi:hypothetical protein
MCICIFVLLSTCWFIELNSFLAWLIRSLMSAVSLSAGVKKEARQVTQHFVEGNHLAIYHSTFQLKHDLVFFASYSIQEVSCHGACS